MYESLNQLNDQIINFQSFSLAGNYKLKIDFEDTRITEIEQELVEIRESVKQKKSFNLIADDFECARYIRIETTV